jgi:ring-1,2-phenylacetyl-CoA epoxidase subunit PaaC
MDPELKPPLAGLLTDMGDDELILGHRDSEWCGRAPIIEEDIAFANIALDEIGHANLWYGLLAGLLGEDEQKYPDRLVFGRQPSGFRNLQMVELPDGDWAFTMLRQYLFDTGELVWLNALVESRYTPLADAAAKVRKEEIYHHRHTRAWVQRLSQGTDDSHRRMQQALEALWPYTGQMFKPLPQQEALAAAGLAPEAHLLRSAWEGLALPLFRECELQTPDGPGLAAGREEHTGHLKTLVAEMQSVARMDLQAEW